EVVMHKTITLVEILLVIFMYEVDIFFQRTVINQVFRGAAKHMGAVLAYIMNLRMHHGAGGDYPVRKETIHLIKKSQQLIPVCRISQGYIFADIGIHFISLPQYCRFFYHDSPVNDGLERGL